MFGKNNLQVMGVDECYVRRCMQLARCAAGSTTPNPQVGAVIVCDGRIIGEGYHIRAGEPHAEVNAVRSVKPSDRHLLPHSTIYVTLEPCSHYGKTPPCCDLIIKEGIRRVVIGTTDNNECVNGAGIARMKNAGIEVVVGVLQNECYAINRPSFLNFGSTSDKNSSSSTHPSQLIDSAVLGRTYVLMSVSDKF